MNLKIVLFVLNVCKFVRSEPFADSQSVMILGFSINVHVTKVKYI